jgi:hypothetical protein
LLPTLGVGHPVEALTDLGRTDARCAEIERCAGVVRVFHVSEYSVEPAETVLARYLFAKDDARAALADEPIEGGPEMAFVVEASAGADLREWLAGATRRPDQTGVGPSCPAEGERPDADTGEEVTLRVAGDIAGSDVDDASSIDVAQWNKSS